MVIEPKTKADQDKLDDALSKLAIEDPTFKIHHDQETSQTLISGMGELHLEVMVERMLREFNVKANVGRPQVAYKETITATVESEGRFIHQSGGKGQYGHVWLKLEPNERGKGFEFSERLRGGALPKEFVPAIETGAKLALQSGSLAGYPVVDIKVTLCDGSYHEVDSSELAFRMAASLAIREGQRKAKSIILEPIMEMEIVTPSQFLGDIVGNLNSRRSHIEDMDSREDFFIIHCVIPLAETFGFASDLRSLSQGRASHTMQFHSYKELPANLTEQIMARGFLPSKAG